MTNKKILLIGGSGFVGAHLFSRLGPNLSTATYFQHAIQGGVCFDAAKSSLSELVDKSGIYSHAVLMFGITNPDACFRDIEHSYEINVKRTKIILDKLKELNIIPLFLSSEAVFDGNKGNYTEEDEAKPILAYGAQKLEVEDYIKQTHKDFLIVRLARVFGSKRNDGTLFTSWMEQIEKKEDILCARDQVFSPIHVDDVCEGLIRLMDKDSRGIFNLSNSIAYARLNILKILLSHCKKWQREEIRINECSVRDLNILEPRPLNISMRPDKIIRETGLQIRDLNYWCDEITRRWFEPVRN